MAPNIHVISFVLLSFLLQVGHGKCPPSFHCGNLGDIRFPFTNRERPECGLLSIYNCEDRDPEAIKTIKNNGKWFFVEEIGMSNITVRDNELGDLLLSGSCGAFSKNFTFITDSPFFDASINPSVILYTCKRTLNLSSALYFFNSTVCPDDDIFYKMYHYSVSTQDFAISTYPEDHYKNCSIVQLPNSGKGIMPDGKVEVDLFRMMSDKMTIEIQVTHQCDSCYHLEGGQCQLDKNGKFFCAKEKTRKALLMAAGNASSNCNLVMLANNSILNSS
ncbi:hypothetical protein L6164_006614 [Bauhinia variegata]|uniref:Uncharacterized protein n=1 Tax=Bauhinia variegata TaxID=167791 RepID=A0ACB9PXP0_BAUVA|nr:hypothetical protein L6164_006614 [Bauhinia variegata]